MKVPFSWLKEYVDIDVTAQELEDKLFGCGFEVEELIDLSAEIDRVVVGVVKECTPVEGTHLCTCKVDCGEYGNDIQIVRRPECVCRNAHTGSPRQFHTSGRHQDQGKTDAWHRVQRYALLR